MKRFVIFQFDFAISSLSNSSKHKYIVECQDEQEAKQIASDMASINWLHGIKVTDDKENHEGCTLITTNDYHKVFAR